jgi:hypothetical protein
MVDLEQPNLLRLHNIDEPLRLAIKSSLIKYQPHLEQISEANDFTEFRWTKPVWASTKPPSSAAAEEVNKEVVLIQDALAMAAIGALMLAMNKNEFNIYGASRLASHSLENRKRCQLIFRQSNVAYSQYLCIHLSGIITYKIIC